MNVVSDVAAVEAAMRRALAAILKDQRADGHWVYELEADCTIPSEYVLLVHFLGEEANLELEKKIGVYLRRIQGAHGGWPLFHGGPLDISATVKAYFALKMIGDDITAPHMARAREEILKRGGAGRANVFTRIQLALYGELDWKYTPTVPPELILLPLWFPIHLSKMSYWARTVIVPLLVLAAKKPLARNRRGVHVPELFAPGKLVIKRAPQQKRLWYAFFNTIDWVLKRLEPVWPTALRDRAIRRCLSWTTERLNGADGLGAIYPAMANNVMMYDTLGVSPEDPRRAIARESVEKLLVIKDGEAYCQPCVSPVWDTALVCHALMETNTPEAETAVKSGLEWLQDRQVLDVKGDWATWKPDVRPGGWAFQYNNAYYPDLDDTAVAVMALDRAKAIRPEVEVAEAIGRGREWVEGLQSRNGGWGAFDADNGYFYLNNIPFADHGALLDPPTEDVSGRCLGMLAQLGEPKDSPKMKAAIAYLEKVQLADGSWYGRWGVNYIYGTWSVLAGLNAAGVASEHAMMRRAVAWLTSIQNPDGGWGEDCDSYKLDYRGYQPAPSTASQTAWALLGLMAAGETDSDSAARGIAYLQKTQGADGLWPQEYYTGGGFPRVFYLRYHGYPKFFPLWALARYRNLKAGNSRRVLQGL
jgi:squalene-hopene/tetraprenyl-beta-curcumene cyclase